MNGARAAHPLQAPAVVPLDQLQRAFPLSVYDLAEVCCLEERRASLVLSAICADVESARSSERQLIFLALWLFRTSSASVLTSLLYSLRTNDSIGVLEDEEHGDQNEGRKQEARAPRALERVSIELPEHRVLCDHPRVLCRC